MMINGAHSTSTGASGVEMSVLERQRAVLKWQQDQLQISQFPQQQQQQQQQQTYFSDFSMLSLHQTQQNFQGGLLVGAGESVLNELLTPRPIKPDPSLESGSGWNEYGVTYSTTTMDNSSGYRHGFPSCPPAAAKESFRKRKADHKTLLPPKQAEIENESRAKKVNPSCEDDALVPKKGDQNNHNKNSHSRLSSSSSNNCKNGDKESKSNEGCDAQKSDYIHVRARRGQATDSHSLAERVRREKISERMKYLQDLVPGCNKITGKAGMLDEIINYVQSLQRQVEFLSMKLAAVNPTLDFNIEDLFSKEVFEACSSNFRGSEITSDMANLAYLAASDLGMSEVEMGLRRSISAPVSIPETYLDSSCLTQKNQTYLPWDQSDVQTMYNMDFQHPRQQSYPSQAHTGAN